MARSCELDVCRDLGTLHPVCKRAFLQLETDLIAAGNPLRVFEGWRSPDRQDRLERSGRNVTKAAAWESAHQYGLACDFAVPVKRNGGWSWVADTKHWRELAVLAARQGLHVPSPGWDPGDGEHPSWPSLKAVLSTYRLTA
jgi:hypothetical protein